MGGRNSFLGIAYVVVGGLCIMLGAVFTVMHLLKPRYGTSYDLEVDTNRCRKLGDHSYLSWNKTDERSSAVSTGVSRPGTA